MINRVVLIGRLTKDITLKKTNNGKTVTSFTVAVDRRGKDAGADFITCRAWEKTAELLATYCGKGSQVGIEGHIVTGSYDDTTTGKKVYTTDVYVDGLTFLDNKQNTPQDATERDEGDEYVTPDDLPF